MTTASPDIVIAHVALLRAVDSLLATAAELREARAELGRLIEQEKTHEAKHGKRKATADAARSR